MKLPKHIRKEIENCLEDARDVLDNVLYRTRAMIEADDLIARAQSLLKEAKHGTR